jgi:hypothetical protein
VGLVFVDHLQGAAQLGVELLSTSNRPKRR